MGLFIQLCCTKAAGRCWCKLDLIILLIASTCCQQHNINSLIGLPFQKKINLVFPSLFNLFHVFLYLYSTFNKYQFPKLIFLLREKGFPKSVEFFPFYYNPFHLLVHFDNTFMFLSNIVGKFFLGQNALISRISSKLCTPKLECFLRCYYSKHCR